VEDLDNNGAVSVAHLDHLSERARMRQRSEPRVRANPQARCREVADLALARGKHALPRPGLSRIVDPPTQERRHDDRERADLPSDRSYIFASLRHAAT